MGTHQHTRSSAQCHSAPRDVTAPPCTLQSCSSCVQDIRDLLLSAIQITLQYFDGESMLANTIIEFRGTCLIYYENCYTLGKNT